MELNKIKPGMKVGVVKLGSTMGMFVDGKHLRVRKVGITGTVQNWVPRNAGEVWWVLHDKTSDVGAYCFDELEEIN